MNDNYNSNNTTGSPENNSNPPHEKQNVWSVPPQDGQGYRAPYGASSQQQGPAPQEPHQYSTSNGWQRPASNTPQRKDSYQWNYAEYEQAQTAKPPRKKKGLMVFSIVMASIVVVSLVSFAGVGIASLMGSRGADNNSQPPSLQVPSSDLPGMSLQDKPSTVEETLPEGKLTTMQVVQKVEPSIVAITTYIGGSRGYQAEGMGSGIIILEDGYIVTNAHVVEGARGITVTLSDGETKYEGRVIGSDTQTDLAVIKIDATGLPAATFGNSDQIQVGEKVIAIGNPQSLDFAGSVTQGIVSGLNRSLSASDGSGGSVTSYTGLIQTDAAINPGNSGGALVNEYGQVIGINSAKVVATGSDGMGFAIPSNNAKPIVDDLIQHGRVTGRVLLGITVYQIDQVSARLNNIPMGLYVQSTSENSDISRKGVVPGDIITKVNDKEITAQQVLTDEIKDKKPGDSVKLEIYRPGATPAQTGRFFEVTVKLIEDMGTASADTQQDEQNVYGYENPETQPPSGQQPYSDDYSDFFNWFK